MEKQRAKEQNRTGSQNQQEKAPLVPYRFLTHGSQGLEIDLRLCNRDIIGSAKPHLLHILNTAMQVIFSIYYSFDQILPILLTTYLSLVDIFFNFVSVEIYLTLTLIDISRCITYLSRLVNVV